MSPPLSLFICVLLVALLPESCSFSIPCLSSASQRSPQQKPRYQRKHLLSIASFASSTSELTNQQDTDDSWDNLTADITDFDPSIQTTQNEAPEVDESADDSSDYDVSVWEFVDMMCDSPVGAMEDEEIGVLRTIMGEISHTLDQDDDTDGVTAARAIERLFYRMIAEWQAAAKSKQKERAEMLEPNSHDFLLIMQAWENTVTTDEHGKNNNKALAQAVQHVNTLYSDQKDMARRGPPSIQLTNEIGGLVLRLVSSSRDRGLDRKVWSTFEDLKANPAVHVDAGMYASVILSLAKSRDRRAADRAESMLREAAEKFPPAVDENGKSVGISIESFNVVLTAWAKSSQEDGPDRAEKLIVFMDQLDADHGELGIVKPNVSSFTSLIDAYAQTNDWESVGQAERILNRLLDLFLEDEEGAGFEPNIASWTIVISAWGRQARDKRKAAAGRAGRLLKRMESLYEEGRITFAPDAIAYVTVMNAFAFSKTPDGPVRAEEILNELHEKYLDGDNSMKPTAKSIQVVIDSWAKSENPGAMEQAELALDRYEDMLEEDSSAEETDGVSEHLKYIYRTMLFGWARSSEPVRAQQYLLGMMERKMDPDSFCFDKIIEANTAMGDDGSMTRTYELFELMEKSRQKGDFKPNERVYTSFIRAMTRARVANLAHKASMILKRMQSLYEEGNRAIKPTVFTYNAVLNACAESSSSENSNPLEAFKVAIKVFNDLRNCAGEQPDHVSFGNMLRCANLLPVGDQKDALIKTTFELCRDQGLVNSYILRDLQFAASEDVWRPLIDCTEGAADIELLPPQWSRNLQRRK
jgi:hypothetical protein